MNEILHFAFSRFFLIIKGYTRRKMSGSTFSESIIEQNKSTYTRADLPDLFLIVFLEISSNSDNNARKKVM